VVVRRYTKVTTNRYILIALCVLIITAVIGAGIARADTTPLANVEPGSTIRFSGLEWIVLEHKSDGKTYIILKTPTVQRAFDPDRTNRFDPTDSNNIGYYLNTTFYNSLSQKELIETVTWQQEDYPGVSAKIGLLTLSEYTQYSTVYQGSVLPNIPYQWWLLSTPTSTTEFVCTVDGTLYGYWSNANADSGDMYVRPALYLRAGLVLDENNNVSESTRPASPTGLSATAESPSSVKLTWHANTEQDLAGYKIYRNGVQIADVGKVTTFTDSTASAGTTYSYEIVAYNTAGQESERSNPVIVTTPSGTLLHDKPAGTVITFSGKQWIILEQMPDGETYLISKDPDCQRAFDDDNTNLFNPSDSNNIAYYLNNTFYNSLSQKGFISDHVWDRLAIDVNGNSSTDYGHITAKVGLISFREYERYSIAFEGTILPGNYEYLWWTRSPRAEYSDHVWYVHTDGDLSASGGYADDASFSVRPTIYLQAGILVDQNNEVIGEETTGSPPAAPIGLAASATSPTSVDLTWQANTEQDLAGYKIYRNGVQIADVGKVTTFTDSTASAGITYSYEIVAYNTAGQESPRSNPATVTTPIPAATLGAWWKGDHIEVVWSAGTTELGNSAFLWRQMENGPWQAIKNLIGAEKNAFTFKDTNVAIGLNCRYEIRQHGGISNFFRWTTVAESGWATGDRPFCAPSGVHVISYTENTALVSWNDVQGGSPYTVRYSTDGGNTWHTTQTTANTVTVPRSAKVQIKAQGTYSHWSGIMSVQ